MTRRHATQQKPQATRYTPQEEAYMAYWEARGYRFGPGEKPPINTHTPPGAEDSFQHRHPILDALIGSLILGSFSFGLIALWIWAGAK